MTATVSYRSFSPLFAWARDFPLALRLAVRELRGGLRGFYVLVSCVALGVAAITIVGVLSQALRNGLSDQGRTLLGGDLSFQLVHRRASTAERAFFGKAGRMSETATLRTIARLTDDGRSGSVRLRQDGQLLVDLKAVDEAYPLAGELRLRGGKRLNDVVHEQAQAAVDPLLLERLGLSLGSQIKIGSIEITVGAVIEFEPDRLTGRLNFGPRVMISQKTLDKTGLVQPGSLVRWNMRLALTGANTGNSAIESVKRQVKQRFPQAGFTVHDRLDPAPGIKTALDRFSQFLTLVGLAALFIGGIGVASAVNAHISRKREVIATFKCLGAASTLIFQIYLLQILMLAGVGIVLGLLAGLAIPFALGNLFSAALPVQLVLDVPPSVLALATAYGVLVALSFMLWPLGRSRDIRAAELFRQDIVGSSSKPRLPTIAITGLLITALVALTLMVSHVKFVSLVVCLAFAAMYVLFVGFAMLLRLLFQRLPRSGMAEMALALSALSSPTPRMRTVILALGLGLSLLVTVTLVDNTLVSTLRTGLPKEVPSYFFVDIDRQDYPRFNKLALATAPGARLAKAPMLRGRLMALAGRPVEEVHAPGEASWVLHGDRGLTYAQELPAGSKVVAGKWWPKAYAGPPLVSFEAHIAKALGLKLGDMITVNVLGRNITARIANMRRVKWESLALNFVMIFSPNTLQAAPHKLLATLSLPENAGPKVEARLISSLLAEFPTVTPIRVRDAINAVSAVVERIMSAVRLTTLVTLLAGAIVLAGALATTNRQRIYETVIYKTLGATRRRIVTAHLLEYLVLAFSCAVLSTVIGTFVAVIIVTQIMDLEFSFAWGAVLQALLAAVVLVVPLGIAGTWRMLAAKPAAWLRA